MLLISRDREGGVLKDLFHRVERLLKSSSDDVVIRGCYNRKRLYIEFEEGIYESILNAKNSFQEFDENDTLNISDFSIALHEIVHWWQFVGTRFGLFVTISYFAGLDVVKPFCISLYKEKGISKPVVDMVFGSGEALTYNKYFRNFIGCFASEVVARTLGMCAKGLYFSDFEKKCILECAVKSVNAIIEKCFRSNINLFEMNEVDVDNIGRRIDLVGVFRRSVALCEKHRMSSLDIIEGQARFVQVMFLDFSRENKLDWDSLKKGGYIEGEYIKAYDVFSDILSVKRCGNLDHSLIGLFLIVCDISLSVYSPDNKCGDDRLSRIICDPVYCFVTICCALPEIFPDIREKVKDFSKNEYVEICTSICNYLCLPDPVDAFGYSKSRFLKEVVELFAEEVRQNTYLKEFVVIKILVLRFVKYLADKSEHPDFFCWPFAFANSHFFNLMRNNLPILIRDSSGVKPILFGNIEDNYCQALFQSVCDELIGYDLGYQMIFSPGEFEFDLTWLIPGQEIAFKELCEKIFLKYYGILPGNL
jgi:hypothetical protein